MLLFDLPMPKGCFDINGNNKCPFFNVCKENKESDYFASYVPFDCLIKGEIPDEHGRLIDEDTLKIDDSWSLTDTGRIWSAPTILEATK